MAGVRTIEAPTVLPIALEEAKAHLRVISSDEDALIQAMIRAASGQVEAHTKRTLLKSKFELYLDRFPRCAYGRGDAPIVLPRTPLVAVDSVTYFDVDGVEQTLDPSDYAVEAFREPARIHPVEWWPPTDCMRPDRVKVAFSAGYADPDAVPPVLKQGALLFLAHLYRDRSAFEIVERSGQILEIPAFQSLLNSARILEFA